MYCTMRFLSVYALYMWVLMISSWSRGCDMFFLCEDSTIFIHPNYPGHLECWPFLWDKKGTFDLCNSRSPRSGKRPFLFKEHLRHWSTFSTDVYKNGALYSYMIYHGLFVYMKCIFQVVTWAINCALHGLWCIYEISVLYHVCLIDIWWTAHIFYLKGKCTFLHNI